jgi:hypothetical protein
MARIKALRPLFDRPTREDEEAERQRVAAERARRATERAHKHTAAAVKRHGFTIDEFCFSHGFSRATYYNLKAKQQAPEELRVLGKVIITDEAGARWRKKRAAAAREHRA